MSMDGPRRHAISIMSSSWKSKFVELGKDTRIGHRGVLVTSLFLY
jgi:hypothetical protein